MELTTTRYILNPDNNKFVEVSSELKAILEHEYKQLVSLDTIRFFRRLGGKEIISRDRASGNINKIVSISPDKKIKTERLFKWK
jgi:hypothetical protein